jgi:hypothetical protein
LPLRPSDGGQLHLLSLLVMMPMMVMLLLLLLLLLMMMVMLMAALLDGSHQSPEKACRNRLQCGISHTLRQQNTNPTTYRNVPGQLVL